jgi:DNA-binding GntR family transcriptional regulator
LEVIPGRAIRVVSPSIQHIFDALRVRKLLEPSMMQALAEQITAEDLAQLQSITAEMETAAHLGDRVRWSRADNQWHELLSAACPNALLGEMVLQIRNRIFTTAADENVTDQYLIDGTAEHKDIVAAIQAGDGALAYQLAVRHIENLQADMSKRYNLPR